MEPTMLTKYLKQAMELATYEILENGTFYGEIPGFSGVYANAPTLESAKEQLQEVLEGWIILGLRLQHQLPVIDGIDLTPQQKVA
jgi:predicted RNase H-like HicB family nuclease